MSTDARIYLIPTWLDDSARESLPEYVLEAIRECQVFFVEDERTTRRYFKAIRKEMVIDDHEWFRMDQADTETQFREAIRAGKTIGIVSEAGCPGVADPGQALVAIAQSLSAVVKPLVGPSSILLALMASGMNGQSFAFHGYLPIDAAARNQTIRALEQDSIKQQRTQLFIETPYRNNSMLQALVQQLQPSTRLCIAVDLTAPTESIQTRTVAEWKNGTLDLHKRPALFLIQA
jgi:16S rRNA (cytidine1402-2'-O)-methyltransferase